MIKSKIILGSVLAVLILIFSCTDTDYEVPETDNGKASKNFKVNNVPLSVMTWNLFLLDVPDFANIFTSPDIVCEGDACAHRAGRVANFIELEMPTENYITDSPDILFFQEVWVEQGYDALINSLTNSGYPHHTQFDHGSGLLTMSKFPITTTLMTRFNSCHGDLGNGSDCRANKGFLTTTIDHPVLGPVHLINTHADAGNSQNDITTRAAQFTQIRNFLFNLVINSPIIYNYNDPVILAGDFNTEHSTEIASLNAKLETTTVNLLATSTQVSGCIGSKTLDHILIYNGLFDPVIGTPRTPISIDSEVLYNYQYCISWSDPRRGTHSSCNTRKVACKGNISLILQNGKSYSDHFPIVTNLLY